MNVRLPAIAGVCLVSGVCAGQVSLEEVLGIDYHLSMHPDAPTTERSEELATFFRGATVETIRPHLDSEHLLQQAARYTDNEDIIAFLIASGFDPNAAFGPGIQAYPQDLGPELREGPLHYAAAYNPVPGVVGALIRGGADVNALGGWMLETPLHRAAERNNGAVIAALIKGGANPSAVNGRISSSWSRSANINGNTPLHGAACNQDASVIDVLVGAGANVASRNGSGLLPLHFAVLCEQTASVAALKRHGADFGAVVTLVNEEDEMHICTGCNVVHLLLNALIDDHEPGEPLDLGDAGQLLRALIDAGASVNAKVDDVGWYAGYSPLRLAIEGSLGPGVVALLIEVGAQPKSELLHALFAGQFQYAGGNRRRNLASADNLQVLDQLLGQKGINVDARDYCGRTPLHRAASFGYMEPGGIEKVIERLIAGGADVNTRLDAEHVREECRTDGFTPLHEAARWGGEDDSGYAIASMLLAAGADANVRNPAGESALDIAANDRMKGLLAHAEPHRHDTPTERPKPAATAEREERDGA